MSQNYRPPCLPFNRPGMNAKFQAIEDRPCKVNMHEAQGSGDLKVGRPSFGNPQKNFSNPYQFDRFYTNRFARTSLKNPYL